MFPFVLHYLALSSNDLQKGENLQIGVDKLIGKMWINLLCHTVSCLNKYKNETPQVGMAHAYQAFIQTLGSKLQCR